MLVHQRLIEMRHRDDAVAHKHVAEPHLSKIDHFERRCMRPNRHLRPCRINARGCQPGNYLWGPPRVRRALRGLPQDAPTSVASSLEDWYIVVT